MPTCLVQYPGDRVQSALEATDALSRLRGALERAERLRPVSERVTSIPVLPFVNQSTNADGEYISDGLADELLTVVPSH